jgi:hypothetical protein
MDSQFQPVTPQPAAPQEQYSTPAQPQPAPVAAQPKKGGKGKLILVALLFLLIGAAAGYMFRDSTAKSDAKASQVKMTALQAQNTQLSNDLATAKKAAVVAATPAPGVRPDDASITAIENAVKAGKYTDLAPYAASTVKVVIAASEGQGDRTPAQMATDMQNYLKNPGTWDFNVPAATLAKYQAGDYKQYFPTTALVGKSSSGMVLSFNFDSKGKISTVFMAVETVLIK